MRTHGIRRHRSAPPAPGVSLIELMIALVLGLVVTGAAIAMFLTNRQTYIASENVGRMQENARTAFELMSRDLREAAGNACGAGITSTVNVLDPGAGSLPWYADFAGGIRGYNGATAFADAAFGTGAAQRVAGTDAIEIKSSFSSNVTIESHNPSSAQFKVNTINHGLAPGDIAMACDSNHAAIFQVTNASPGTNDTIVHNTGEASPGNCTKGLGSPLNCGSPLGTSYEFGCAFGGAGGIDCTDPKNRWTAIIAKLKATRWFIGYNGRGGKSLYQGVLRNSGGALVVDTNEITEGVDAMTLEYLTDGGVAYAPAGAGTDWSRVTAVRLSLHIAGQDKIGTDGKVLERWLDHVIAIRNRAP